MAGGGKRPGWMMPTWYQTLVAISGLLALILAYKEMWTAVIFLGGVLLIGMAEWSTYRREVGVIPGLRVAKALMDVRKPDWRSWALGGSGVVLILVSAFRLLQNW
jgi:hypothetical protein